MEQAEPDVVHGEEKLSRFSILYGGENSKDEVKNRIIDLFSQGTYRFVGGTQQLVDALCLYIVRHGGQIVTNEKIDKIVIENGKVKAIRQFTSKITNRKQESMSEIFWIRRNSDGKLNKKVFEDVLNCPVQQEVKKFLAENCPELSLFNKKGVKNESTIN